MFYQLNYGHQDGHPAQPNGSGFIQHDQRDVTSSERKSEPRSGPVATSPRIVLVEMPVSQFQFDLFSFAGSSTAW